MAWFNFTKKKEEISFKFLVPFFEEVSGVLVEYNTSDSVEDDERCCSLVEIFTTSSALVAASYHVKIYMACNGNIDKKTNTEVAGVINPFFVFISELCIKTAEKETGLTFNKQDMLENLKRIQGEKIRKYAQSILKTIEKGRGVTAGVDITHAVTEDLYKKEIFDMMLAAQLFDITFRVKK